jgi:hypothetical protein
MTSNESTGRRQDAAETVKQAGGNRAPVGRAMHAEQQPDNEEYCDNRRKPGGNRTPAALRVPPNNDNGEQHEHAIGGGVIDKNSGPGRRKNICHWGMVSFA